jgi:acetyl esterase/lipase
LEYKSGHKIEIYLPEQYTTNTLVLAWFHGGGWKSGELRNMTDSCMEFVARGYICTSADYSLYPNWAFKGDAVADVADCYDYLKQQFPQNPIHMVGSSAGGQLVAAAVNIYGIRPRSCILLYPPLDLARLPASYGPIWSPETTSWSPYHNIPFESNVPMVLYYGTADNLIPQAVFTDYRSLSAAYNNFVMCKPRTGRAHGFLNNIGTDDWNWFVTHVTTQWLSYR